MRRWILACLALLCGVLVNVALELRSTTTADPGSEPAPEAAATAAPRIDQPG